jgi:hypothetical protein
MKGFVANHEDFVEVCPEESTISQREKACREFVEVNVDNFKRIDFYTDQRNSRKSCYLIYKNQKLYLCSYVYRRPPSHIGNWQAYEYAKVLDNLKPFTSKEEAIEWVREKKYCLNGVVNAVAWSDSANHCYMNENCVIQEINDFETPGL